MSRLLKQKAEIEARLLAADPSCDRFLYHGTSHADPLKVIEPRSSQTMVDKIRGDFVFAAADLMMPLVHANKISVDDWGGQVGVDIFNGLTGAENSKYGARTTYYCVISRPDSFNALSRGGFIYGVKPEGFVERPAGEYTSEAEVCAEFRLRVDGLKDLMEADVQVFVSTDETRAYEILDNLNYYSEQGERALILDQGTKAGMFRWLNKEEGYEVPEGPMCDW